MRGSTSALYRFGSLTLELDAEPPFWTGAMLDRFRATPHEPAGLAPDLVLRVSPIRGAAQHAKATDTLRIDRIGARVRVESDAMSLDADWSTHPATAELTVHPDEREAPYVEHYFAIFLHKLLQLCGVVRLHGAAVEVAGATHVFLGDKGTGKSTIALALGQAGGRVLADDQLVIRRRGAATVVSGCDGNIRLTDESERHFLDAPLDARPADFGGVMKKEVPLDWLVSAIPHEDRVASRLYFPAVGQRLAVRPISRRATVVRILNDIAPAHRFAGTADQWDLVRFVTDFVEPLACADLELSPDLTDMARLPGVLTS